MHNELLKITAMNCTNLKPTIDSNGSCYINYCEPLIFAPVFPTNSAPNSMNFWIGFLKHKEP